VPHVTRLRREPSVERDGWTRTSVVMEHPWEERQTLWYDVRLPEGWKLSPSSDALVLVPLFKAMRAGGRLEVEGELSPSLLANLEELQAIMACWYRGRFHPVEIVAEREVEQPPGAEGALTAFSGGVDSCFTAYRHVHGLAGRQTQKLVAGVMAQGFDIPIGEDQGFASAADKAEAMLATLGLPLIRMATNTREFEHAWDDMMAAAIASCFALLQPQARAGLIPGEFAYHLLPTWGVHPLSDPLLSSDSLRIVHDGAGYTRMQKIEQISEWPAAMRDLRVCWAGRKWDRNCCKCSKCVRTVLAFRSVGLDPPPSFEEDVTDADIRALGRLNRQELYTQRALLDTVEERGITGSWVDEARRLYYRSRGRDSLDLLADFAGRRLRSAVRR
jgi:hypothetical protein